MGEWWSRWAGRLGLLLPVLLWGLSIAALMEGLQANEAAGWMAGGQPRAGRVEHLRGLAVMWCLALAGLQIAAGLVGAGVIRGVYRLRTAVCFAAGAGGVIGLNVTWLLGVLVWLRVYGDTR